MNNYNNREGKNGGHNNKSSYGGGGRGSGRPQVLHDATCAGCGNKAQVPFKPTGEKPVYCRDCFGAKREGDYDRGRNQDKKRNDRGGDRREFNTRTLSSPGTAPSPFADLSKLQSQVDALHEKMNKVIAMLSGEDQVGVQTNASGEEVIKKAKTEKRTKKVKTADLKETLASIKDLKPKLKKEAKAKKTPSKAEKVEKKSAAKKPATKKSTTKKVTTKKTVAKEVAAKK